MTVRSALAAAASMVLLAGAATLPARADSGLVSGAQAIGSFLDAEGFVSNQNADAQNSVFSGVTVSARTSCVPRHAGEVGCSAVLPLPTDHWWQNGSYPVFAAADAVTTFGTNHLRTWSHGNHDVVSSEGGATSYLGAATSEWTESITYSGAPGLVTFVMRLTASWNNGGRFTAYGGVPFYNPDGPNQLDGQIYHNCPAGIGDDGSCVLFFEQGQAILIPGNDPQHLTGNVDQIITFSVMFTPEPYDPEDPNWTLYPVRDFVVGLQSEASGLEGAEFDAFHTMSLQQILIPAGASISFGSGTAYNVAVVPEPGTAALWLAGLLSVGGVARRRRRGLHSRQNGRA